MLRVTSDEEAHVSQSLTIESLLTELTAADASSLGSDFAEHLRELPQDRLDVVLRHLRVAIRCGSADRRTFDTIVAAVAAA